MICLWQLPEKVCLEGKIYDIHADFRDILELFSYLEDPDLPESVRWRIALGLFYEQPVPPEHRQAAMEYLVGFLTCGHPDTPGPKLLCWQQDAQAIISGVNRAAGQELRAIPFVHWWTFLGWFHAIGEGPLSTLVSIRDKLRRGKPLEGWEKDFYRENRQRIDLPKHYSREEQAQIQALQDLLDGPQRKEEPDEQ